MTSRGLEAIQVQHGKEHIFVQTLDPKTGKKGILALGNNNKDENWLFPEKEKFNTLI